MILYLTPANDEVCAKDMERLTRFNVRRVVLNLQEPTTVQQVVHLMTLPSCTALVLPDDYHRHNDLIEYVKTCAIATEVPISPVTRYCKQHAPAPASASVHANAAAAGVGANHRVPAAAG